MVWVERASRFCSQPIESGGRIDPAISQPSTVFAGRRVHCCQCWSVHTALLKGHRERILPGRPSGGSVVQATARRLSATCAADSREEQVAHGADLLVRGCLASTIWNVFNLDGEVRRLLSDPLASVISSDCTLVYGCFSSFPFSLSITSCTVLGCNQCAILHRFSATCKGQQIEIIVDTCSRSSARR